MERATGTVKWFSQEKGFGFVTREDGTDVFVHHSGITGRGFKTLDQGERVEFDIIEEPKGLKAQNLARVDAPDGGEGHAAAELDDNIGNRAPRDDIFGNRAGYGDTGYNRGGGRDDRPSRGRGYGGDSAPRDYGNW